MEKPTKTFGEFIKEKRMAHTPRYTLKKMAELLDINITQLSDIENGRKKPFDADKIELFCEILELAIEDKNEMYDLAARDSNSVPADIKDTIMYNEQGDLARVALRKVNQGKGNVELWKELIRKMDETDGE
ncbi:MULTISPECIES: helix-turn-helix domain-containing protein [Eubacterium]|uniref:helix-turn-helix domain-containing protein n=1 Tax=Eubacterium TaxID=1730 RepID=UPI0015687653|nr:MULTISPECIES: helix-turn-helix transcriptional regulator [Eubacterium]MCR5368552.1 helix-turn-helix domain-containing protein [Eubacterium sp.]